MIVSSQDALSQRPRPKFSASKSGAVDVTHDSLVGMENEILQNITEQAVGTFFAVLQVAVIGAFSMVLKMHVDIKQLKRDVDSAHKKLRDI